MTSQNTKSKNRVRRALKTVKNYTLRLSLMAILLSFVLMSCRAYIKNETHDIVNSYDFPKESFVLVLTTYNLSLAECSTAKGKVDCDKIEKPGEAPRFRSKGSGAVVHVSDGNSYILTAGHVCMPSKPYQIVTYKGNFLLYEITSSVSIVSYKGGKRSTSIVAVDNKNDLCVVKTAGQWADPIEIADDLPPIGTKVYNMAAPFGIFDPGMVPLLDGYYSGYDRFGNHFFTVPVRPGSSGSPVLDPQGRIISVIHSAHMMYESIGLGSSLADVKKIVNTAIQN